MRASETPRVFRPGIVWTLAAVTVEPNVLFVAAGFANLSEKKSISEKFALQGNPLTLIAVIDHNKSMIESVLGT